MARGLVPIRKMDFSTNHSWWWSSNSDQWLALADSIWKLFFFIESSQKWFNSKFNSKQNPEYSFNKYSFNKVQNIQLNHSLKNEENYSKFQYKAKIWLQSPPEAPVWVIDPLKWTEIGPTNDPWMISHVFETFGDNHFWRGQTKTKIFFQKIIHFIKIQNIH